MKKILFALLAGCIPALVTTNGAYAQNTANPEILEPPKNFPAIEKALTPVNNNTVGINSISPKALKDFTNRYKNVTGESWEKIKNGFAARFIINGVMNTIYYNKRKWIGSLKHYSEDKMPQNIRAIIKPEYYDYSITSVDEVENIDSNGIPTYIVHLEDKNNIKLVRIYDRQMDVWEKFQKS